MQLSKQQFLNLSLAEQKKLKKVSKRPKKKTQVPGGKTPGPRSNLGSNSAPMSSVPVARSRIVKTARPNMVTRPNGDCFITHREYVGEILASATGPPTTFNLSSFALNPGLASVFPWLSKIAQNYESYQLQRLRFCYQTEAPSSLGGTLVMAIDYDAIDTAPATKQAALAYRGSVRSAPWNDCCHDSTSEDLHKMKSFFIRSGAIPANADLKTYDIGNLFVITQGVTTSGATCGELYVEYSVKLMTPIFEPQNSLAGGSFAGANTQTAANPYGTAPVRQANSVGVSMNNASLLTIIAPGTYLLSSVIGGTVITGVTNLVLTGAVSVDQNAIFNAAATESIQQAVITVTQANATVGFSSTATTITSATLNVALMPSGSGQ